jgi:pimeloyl-ACP methyl ester carboxylesterase
MAKNRHYIIFVPGLADKTYSFWLQLAMFTWVGHWLKTHCFKANWVSKTESFAHKLGRLIKIIDHAAAKGYTVSLVAASAGSSMALNALYKRPDGIHRVISIVGKLKHPEAVAPELYALNPAFEDSLRASANVETKLTPSQRKKILVVRAMRDSYVPSRDGAVKDAHVTTMHTMGHVSSIILALTIYQRRLIRFVKND